MIVVPSDVLWFVNPSECEKWAWISYHCALLKNTSELLIKDCWLSASHNSSSAWALAVDATRLSSGFGSTSFEVISKSEPQSVGQLVMC